MSTLPAIPATIAKSFKGRFGEWSEGESVNAYETTPDSYFIDRLPWTDSTVPLVNQCYNVPKSFLKFDL